MKSNLQVISGKYRGKKLVLPVGARPTQNMARGALFNMLNDVLDTTKPFVVWDAFAGSGAFGIECISRFNNANVVFTDNSANSIDTIKKNLASIKESANVERINAVDALPKFGKGADLIFLDPPYADFGLGALFVKKLGKTAKNGAVLIWEFENIQQTPKIDDVWEVVKDKTYGRARFLFLHRI